MQRGVYGCGYNGFSQVDNFGHIKFDEKDNVTRSSKQIKPSARNKVSCPAFLFQLKGEQVLDKITFTWSRIAATIRKGQNESTTYITGCTSNGRKQSEVESLPGCKIMNDSVVIASSDSDILLGARDDSTPNKILYGHETECQTICISLDNSSAKVQKVAGSHEEFFSVYESISFGKLDPSPVVETDKDRCTVKLQLYPVDSGVPVTDVSCGKEHALCLSKHGTVYSYGLGSRGQLGHGSVEAETSLRVVEALEGVRSLVISAGGWHSAAVSEIGDLYMWGWNESGQLGLSSAKGIHQQSCTSSDPDEFVGIQALPCCVSLPGDPSITVVACGSRHTMILTEHGKVLGSGWNAYGQLGLGHTESRDMFTEVTSLKTPCVNVYAGQWNSVFVCS